MAFVYRYIRKTTGQVVYVGKVKGDNFSDLTSRINQHSYEKYFKNPAAFRVEYIGNLSHADADIYETALINQYQTSPKHNKSKTNWGVCKSIDFSRLEWHDYNPEDPLKPIAVGKDAKTPSRRYGDLLIPTPRQLKSGKWHIQLRLGGKSISVSATTRVDCVNQAALIKAQHNARKMQGTTYEKINELIQSKKHERSEGHGCTSF